MTTRRTTASIVGVLFLVHVVVTRYSTTMPTYFADGKPGRSSKRSYDEAVATRLWQVSAELVGLPETTRLARTNDVALPPIPVAHVERDRPRLPIFDAPK